jgi:hypothetical protein
MMDTTDAVEWCLGIGCAARSASRSTQAVADVIDHYDSNGILAEITDEHVDFVLDEVQNILVQGGHVARALWPAEAGLQAAAAGLRARYGLTDDCALRAQRLADVDARIASALADGRSAPSAAWAGQYLGASADAPDAAVPRLRAYFYDTGVLEFLGARYDLEPITRDLWRIANAGSPAT